MFGITLKGEFVELNRKSTSSNTPALIAVVIENKDKDDLGIINNIKMSLGVAFPISVRSSLLIDHKPSHPDTLLNKLLRLLRTGSRHNPNNRRPVDMSPYRPRSIFPQETD